MFILKSQPLGLADSVQPAAHRHSFEHRERPVSSYGGTTPLYLPNEPVSTNQYAGNAPIRVPYPGYDMNSVLFKAEGISNYNALLLQARKRLSFGLQLTASYTWSHSLDEQSGLGLFFTGNNPLVPRSNYASSDFDQTHVFLVNYSYQIPNVTKSKLLGEFVNGWIISGQTVAESGQPYSVYDSLARWAACTSAAATISATRSCRSNPV